MSVYTCINQQQLEQFLALYSIGKLVNFSGIKEGIENTNYVLSTTEGKFILTIFESLTEKEISGYLHLLDHLCQHEFPAPQPQISCRGNYLNRLYSKPAALFNCLPGSSVDRPSAEQCAEIGKYLAKLHLATENSGFYKKNTKNLMGCQSVFYQISHQLCDKDIAIIKDELDYQLSYSLPELAQGIIHADLFRDNVLFEQGQLSGIVDFYNACHDVYIFDIAIVINDWCIDDNTMNTEKFNALVDAYQKIRLLSKDELQHFNRFLRLAALRFLVSRIDHQLNPREGVLVLQKDPSVFRQLLEYHRRQLP